MIAETLAENRAKPRIPVRCRASARIAVGIEILDASPNGVRVRMSIPLPQGTVLKLRLPSGGERHARVAWAADGLFGCEFMAPLEPMELDSLLAAAPEGALARFG
jgi:hypothetical protein